MTGVQTCALPISTSQLADKAVMQRVQDNLRTLSAKPYVLHTTVVAAAAETLNDTASAHDQVARVEAQNTAEQAFADDPLVKGLVALGGQIVSGSVKSVA